MTAIQLVTAPPRTANKVVFWGLCFMTLMLVWMESQGPESILPFDSSPFRAPDIFLQLDDGPSEVMLRQDPLMKLLPPEPSDATGESQYRVDMSYVSDMTAPSQPYDPAKVKTILSWSNGWGQKREGLKGDARELEEAGCPQPNCYVTSNRSHLPLTQYAAIIMHFRATTLDNIPQIRTPEQRWVFKESEPASYVYQYPHVYDGLFNWTYSYMLDSDIPAPYGRVVEYDQPLSTPPPQGSLNKTKLAAWFVSNCHAHSGRDTIAKSLANFMQVDIYGKCGKMSCSRKSTDSCYEMMEQNYKFYLAFENSLCKDYVTEKLFSVLKYRVVPVVYGSANYSRQAPPNSFINALDFPTVGALAKYLLYLDSNDTAYNEYFLWKSTHRVVDQYQLQLERMCHLCHLLHSDSPTKVYWDLDKWFVHDSHCKTLKKKKNERRPWWGWG